MVEAKTIAILAHEAGQRLDKVLAARLAPLSRSQIKKLIESGRVKRNGQETTVHAFVADGDTIFIASQEEAVAAMPAVPILAETADYIVVNKPAGLLVHPAAGTGHEPTLADWIVQHDPSVAAVGASGRPGIVHRLDRDTSGVMVLAKTPAMFEHLKKQFSERLVKKTYIALVHGRLRNDGGEITLPIARSRRTGRMAARPETTGHKEWDDPEANKPAITRYEVVKRFKKPFTLLQAYPLTGRTHQIRAHLMALTHPVVGDMVYTVKRQAAKIKLGRHFLHATSLRFTDLAGNDINVASPLPAELQTFIDGLA